MRTKNLILVLAGLICFGVFNSCEDKDCIEDLGSVTTEERTFDSFHSIDFGGVGNIFLSQGAEQEVIIEANELLLEHLDMELKNEKLVIELDKCTGGDNYQLDLYITIPEIKELEISGVGDLYSQNAWDLDDLRVELNGVGNAELKGSVDDLHIETDGVGDVQAFELQSKTCEVKIRGVGNAEVNVSDELDVHIQGSGNVYYKGDPQISIQIDGTGSLIDAN